MADRKVVEINRLGWWVFEADVDDVAERIWRAEDERDRLRGEAERANLIAESFKQAAIDIATQKQAEIDTLWKALNAATREEGWE